MEQNKQNCRCQWHPYPSSLTTDVVITVEDQTFHAQKAVLSYFSPVLKDFLEQSNRNSITLKNVSSEVMEILLLYMYTTDLKVNCQNIVEIYRTSQKLGIKDIILECIQILRSENPSAFIYRYTAASQLGLIKAKFQHYKLLLKNLEKCILSDEMMNLDVKQLCEIVTGAGMEDMKTNIKSYCSLFFLASKWVDYNQPERLKHAVSAICCVPFHQMPKDDLIECLFSPPVPYVVEIPEVKRMILSSISRLSTEEFRNEDFED